MKCFPTGKGPLHEGISKEKLQSQLHQSFGAVVNAFEGVICAVKELPVPTDEKTTVHVLACAFKMQRWGTYLLPYMEVTLSLYFH